VPWSEERFKCADADCWSAKSRARVLNDGATIEKWLFLETTCLSAKSRARVMNKRAVVVLRDRLREELGPWGDSIRGLCKKQNSQQFI
jgi:hypothetical protein